MKSKSLSFSGSQAFRGRIALDLTLELGLLAPLGCMVRTSGAIYVGWVQLPSFSKGYRKGLQPILSLIERLRVSEGTQCFHW